jgi:tetratricopeptide (TPR) repeat protein
MSDQRPVNLSASGPPSAVLPPEAPALMAALAAATQLPITDRRAALAEAAARHPRACIAWAQLGDVARDDIEAYAYFRVGYHRGLDALRANGWRGSGYVRWSEPSNHGFLRSLVGLARAAHAIGELDEAERCMQFALQCDPSGIPA